MRTKAILVGGSILITGAAVTALWLAYRATQVVPDFYQSVMVHDVDCQARAGAELESRGATLLGDVQRTGTWEATFTAEQLNGWLATQLKRKFPDLLSNAVHQPRLALRNGRIDLGFRLHRKSFTSVVSVQLGIGMAEPNVIACRVHGVRAGTLPLPLKSVLDEISRLARHWELDIRWAQSEGDPVALVTFSTPDDDVRARTLEEFVLLDDMLYVAGRTVPLDTAAHTSSTLK